MKRVILHSDLNNFYASVECLYRPELRSKPVAVGGDPEQRHGIVLAKNYLAKATGIKTGEALWQARQKCPGLVIVPPNFPLYLRYSRLARKIYADYTDQVESFGLDEAWLDVTGSHILGDGVQIADKIRERMKSELGVTVSVGVSWNKIFAKLGSDLKKPDATTVITRENYRSIVWPLPTEELLYVGRATKRKLYNHGITTISGIAGAEPTYLKSILGKWGEMLWAFANGLDASPVTRMGEESLVKSVGNSTTTPRDLVDEEDVSQVTYVLAESVAARLRESGLEANIIEIQVRDNELFSFTRQQKQLRATNLAGEIHDAALKIFKGSYDWERPIRSIGVRGCDLVIAGSQQPILFDDAQHSKLEKIETVVDDLRRRFGHFAVQRAALLNSDLNNINPKDDHIIHPVGPVGYLKG
ncbi:MAG TPA: DNA polymerase IV [Firmicutes bacterium]|jgi:DNA polymerase-4|nr:DNA polymerase IV [Bacillota bacterium]